ncbi:MAG: ASKHA domain-containing protein [Bacillota bacterium]
MNCTIYVAGRAISVAPGTALSLALNQNEVYVETPCGARGYCRKCLVKVIGEPPEPTPSDREQLTPEELALGYRLSCQLKVAGELTVAVVPAAVADAKKAAMGRLSVPFTVDPWAPLNPAGRSLGFALDVGTTSLAGALLDLTSGEELAAQAAPNPQAVHGADLMSRLSYAIQGEAEREELVSLVRSAARQMLERLLSKAGARPEEVVAATLVGNTAMHHLFLGLPVADLAVAPYTPAVLEGYECRIDGFPPLYALPNIAGFVGADAVAAGLAGGIDQGEETVLVVDIGTNGEMLLRHRGRVYACSAPAGPAFEGGEISQGMRAGPGAIEAVHFDGRELQVGVIKGAPARGICGSGLLDAVAALLDAGLLDWMGRIRPEGPAAHRAAPGGSAVALAPGVSLTQKDIRALQLAKGAIRSGIDLLMQVAGIGPEELDAILLAGAFGNYLRRESAIRIGLLPPVAPERVRPIGNAAAAGAKLALLSKEGRARAEALAREAHWIDLATHPDFEEIFMEALNFPRKEAPR